MQPSAGKLGLVFLIGASCLGGETPEQWRRDAKATVKRIKALKPINSKAKNVILFIGDGMGVSTVTAARIFEGQEKGRPGEEHDLSFDRLPYTALIKTYTTDRQTPDSAGTMTALVTGVKTRSGVISVNQDVKYGDYASQSRNEVATVLELAERAGLSTGVVTTTGVTHATPAACYAHSVSRQWQVDSMMPDEALNAGAKDIARQLIEFPHGDGLEVAMGGGRRFFLPEGETDPEYPKLNGLRADGRNLATEWAKRDRSAYVWNRKQFAEIKAADVDHLLGLFEPGHMRYEHDRVGDSSGEPSLAEMTETAINILSRNRKGYFLMVEGGRIDHAHHACNAYRALDDTVAFSDAVAKAVALTDREETLIVVTADHSHVFTMRGYSPRGHPILGKTLSWGEEASLAKDVNGLPYTTLTYADGPGSIRGHVDLELIDTTLPDYKQESAVPLRSESHGGEDVALYADGPRAHLFRGVLEQNVVFYIMVDALGLESSDDKERE